MQDGGARKTPSLDCLGNDPNFEHTESVPRQWKDARYCEREARVRRELFLVMHWRGRRGRRFGLDFRELGSWRQRRSGGFAGAATRGRHEGNSGGPESKKDANHGIKGDFGIQLEGPSVQPASGAIGVEHRTTAGMSGRKQLLGGCHVGGFRRGGSSVRAAGNRENGTGGSGGENDDFGEFHSIGSG